MSTETAFDRDEIVELLEELGRRLMARETTGTIYVAGGAAIALEFPSRRTTRDIDAVFAPAGTIKEEAEALAADRGLPPNWLSDRVRAFMPPGDDAGARVFAVPGLEVTVASSRYLLAMKMAAGRPQDLHDLVLIFRELGIATAEEAVDIAESVHGPESALLPDRDELITQARAALKRMREPPPR